MVDGHLIAFGNTDKCSALKIFIGKSIHRVNFQARFPGTSLKTNHNSDSLMD